MGTTLRASPRGPQRYPFARHGREFTYKRLRFRADARPQWPNRKSESTSDLPLLNVEPLRKLSIVVSYGEHQDLLATQVPDDYEVR